MLTNSRKQAALCVGDLASDMWQARLYHVGNGSGGGGASGGGAGGGGGGAGLHAFGFRRDGVP